jgi:hypothetical protein
MVDDRDERDPERFGRCAGVHNQLACAGRVATGALGTSVACCVQLTPDLAKTGTSREWARFMGETWLCANHAVMVAPAVDIG